LDGRTRVRKEWRIGDDQLLVGFAARLDPMKDHQTFIQTAAIVSRSCSNAVFVCAGSGTPESVAQARKFAMEQGVENRVIFAGPRNDMPDVYSAFDIGCSSSRFGEGFSNAIAEAMACGTPCVATDVGDAALIIGDTGFVTPPGDPTRLAEAILRLARMNREDRISLGREARKRIVANYSTASLATNTIEAVLRRVELESNQPSV
jgi:glycosyltransferase involved in cell wall biosynthesis